MGLEDDPAIPFGTFPFGFFFGDDVMLVFSGGYLGISPTKKLVISVPWKKCRSFFTSEIPGGFPTPSFFGKTEKWNR